VRWPRYLWRALNARPFNMPIPPLWFGAAAFALLGVFVDPAFYLIGAGATAFCAGLIASNPRFQRAVDAAGRDAPADEHDSLLNRLDASSRERQAQLESQCTELQRVLESARAGSEHINGVWQLAKLHLRLLAARSAAEAVVAGSQGEPGKRPSAQIADLRRRLSEPDLDDDLRNALEDQGKVLEKRVAIQDEAHRRLDVLDAELDRIGAQIALIREQALLTSDPAAIRRSVDALATFLDESSRWMKDQEEIFGDIDALTPDPLGLAGSKPQQWQRAEKRAGEMQ
jgi:hypothetical protein